MADETRIQQDHRPAAVQLGTFMPDACPPRPRFIAAPRCKRLTAWQLDPGPDRLFATTPEAYPLNATGSVDMLYYCFLFGQKARPYDRAETSSFMVTNLKVA